MHDDEIFDVATTLAFWQEAARRLALAGRDDDDNDLGPVTSEDVDHQLDHHRSKSESLLEEGTPYVPALIRLFIEADEDLAALLEAYGRNELAPCRQQAVTELMKQMPGLWAMAAEIRMTNDPQDVEPFGGRELCDGEAPAVFTKPSTKTVDRPCDPWASSERKEGAWPDYYSFKIW